MAVPPPGFRIAAFHDGVLEMRIQDLRSQHAALRADVAAAAALPGLRIARLAMVDMDRGWSELPGLLERVLALPISSLEIENAMLIQWSIAVTTVGRGDYVARALATLERPARIEAFALRGSLLGDAGLERLETFVAGIAQLDLAENELGDAGLATVAGWPECAPLRALRFDRNRPTARGVAAVAALRALESLELRNCRLGAASVRRLGESMPPDLTRLALGANPLGDEGAEIVAESEWSGHLERLDLSACGITDAGARLLANTPLLRAIGELDLRGNRIDDLGRKLLHDRFGERVLTGRMRS